MDEPKEWQSCDIHPDNPRMVRIMFSSSQEATRFWNDYANPSTQATQSSAASHNPDDTAESSVPHSPESLSQLARQAAEKINAQDQARDILNRFMSTIDGDRDYSCDECELITYLCPHLFRRLQGMIAQALLDSVAARGVEAELRVAELEHWLNRIIIFYREVSGLPIHLQAYCMRSEAHVALGHARLTSWAVELADILGQTSDTFAASCLADLGKFPAAALAGSEGEQKPEDQKLG